jgi:hypothetical protein
VSGGQCVVSLDTGSGSPTTSTGNDLFQLEGSWTASEFNVRGPGGGLQANFVPLTTLLVRQQLTSGQTVAPACASIGNTVETNNLNYDSQAEGLFGCQRIGGAVPEIDFVETTFACQPGMCGDNFLGCGKTMNCGGCPSGQYCVNNACSACRGTCPAGFHPCNTDPCNPMCERGLCQ